MDIRKKELYEVFADSLEKSRTKEGGLLFDKLFEDMWQHIEPKLGQSLPIQNVSGISLEQLKLQKEWYRERKVRNGNATAYGEAHNDYIREGVIDHLIALCNYR